MANQGAGLDIPIRDETGETERASDQHELEEILTDIFRYRFRSERQDTKTGPRFRVKDASVSLSDGRIFFTARRAAIEFQREVQNIDHITTDEDVIRFHFDIPDETIKITTDGWLEHDVPGWHDQR